MKNLPERSRKRLVQLSQLLSQQTGRTITSLELEKLTGWSNSVIRRDISFLNCRCGASNGYKINELQTALKQFLGNNEDKKNCCIIGLGKLGETMLSKKLLDGSAFQIIAGFDANVNKTEILHSDFPLYPTTQLERVIKTEKIRYAILTVPDTAAQLTADILCKCGIWGIVNYTKTILTVPSSVAVENISLLSALSDLAAMHSDMQNITNSEYMAKMPFTEGTK